MACNMPVLVLITLFSLVNATAEATASDHGEHDGMPLWVRPRERRLLGLTVGSTPVDAVVADDGSGDHTTVSEAVAAAPRKSRIMYVIYIRRGTYNENVEIWNNNIVLIGDGIGQTIISGSRSNESGYSTSRTATVSVRGRDFMARDLTVENTAGPGAKQAVALLSNSKHSVFYRCELKGFQDTLFAENHLQFYRECEISGTVDFVSGNAKAVFQNCLLLSRRPERSGMHNVVTAQGRNGPDHGSGFSFQNCNVTTREDLTGVDTYLGRAWKSHSHVVFMQSFLDDIVHPSGWVAWNKDHVVEETTRTVLYGEYRNTGPGADVSHRVKWPGFHLMEDAGQAVNYTVAQFIHGNKWLPVRRVEYKPGL